MRKLHWFLLAIFFSGCATLGVLELDNLYGKSNVENRLSQPAATIEQTDHFTSKVKPIIDNRCVVCHGCYDAPCQLKMESTAGIARGANKALVYNGERLLTEKVSESLSKFTSLNKDNLSSLRQQGFFPILNERQQTPQANTQAGLFYQMLALKKEHPLPNDEILSDDFDLGLNRDQQCPTIEEFTQYKDDYPLGGMPYALPGLTDNEHATLSDWLTDGAVLPQANQPNQEEQVMIEKWETRLNDKSLKTQLVARYLFEHLYLANLYFDEQQSSYFKLVRSSTPSGQPVEMIATRRPFDSPFTSANQSKNGDTPQVYYRLIKNNDTIIAKRHMPYPFGNTKFDRINELFFQENYQVNALPDYKLANASNPFKTFQAIPAKARYQFLLDQAQFSIMNFIKGPVCRGQVALNVIEDNFWVAFINPDIFDKYPSDQFINANTELLQLPAGTSDKPLSLFYWQRYAKSQRAYLKQKLTYIETLKLKPEVFDLDLLWSGNGNPNASLTVFRHFDSASVLKGFVGPAPKTAWLITYPILERIHYLLVAGFDVYGSVSHQLKTRLYMDFLRMEAESHFISLLPKALRKKEHEHWYRDTSDDVKDYIFSDDFYQLPESGIKYKTDEPKTELYQLIAQHTDTQQSKGLTSKTVTKQLQLLSQLDNEKINILPEVSYLMIEAGHKTHVISLIKNTAHSNVAHLFSEEDRRIPQEDSLAVLSGIVGTYPNAFFKVQEKQLPEFIAEVIRLQSESDYKKLKDRFAIRRTNPNFWQFADKLHSWYLLNQPESAGLLDFNRLENR